MFDLISYRVSNFYIYDILIRSYIKYKTNFLCFFICILFTYLHSNNLILLGTKILAVYPIAEFTIDKYTDLLDLDPPKDFIRKNGPFFVNLKITKIYNLFNLDIPCLRLGIFFALYLGLFELLVLDDYLTFLLSLVLFCLDFRTKFV